MRLLSLLALTSSAHAADIRVGDFLGDYATLGEAISAASPGDRLLLETQGFAESVVIDKDITLLPVERGGNTWVSPDTSGPAIRIAAGARVKLEGFYLYSEGSQRALEVEATALAELTAMNVASLELQFGAYRDGGLIHNSGQLIVRDSQLNGSGARADRGGVAFGAPGSTNVFDNTTISGGEAQTKGGCLYSDAAPMFLSHSNVSGCAVAAVGGWGSFSAGGALIASDNGGLFLRDSTLTRVPALGDQPSSQAEIDVLLVGAGSDVARSTLDGIGWYSDAYMTLTESAANSVGMVSRASNVEVVRSRFCTAYAEFNGGNVRNTMIEGGFFFAYNGTGLSHPYIADLRLVTDLDITVLNAVGSGSLTRSGTGTAQFLAGLFPFLPWSTFGSTFDYTTSGATSWVVPQCNQTGPAEFTYRYDDVVVNTGLPAVGRDDSLASDPDGSPADLGPMGGPYAPPSIVADADGDGWGAHLDCDDSLASVHPYAIELCNDGIDNDCNPSTGDGAFLVWYEDLDDDGFGDVEYGIASCNSPGPTYTTVSGDCNDGDPAVNPLMPELCDGIDNNCDGITDPVPTQNWYPDTDGDGFGDYRSAPLEQCGDPGPGYVANAFDCDDAVFGAARTLLSSDLDGDGYGDANGGELLLCENPGGMGPPTDCDELDPNVNGGAAEQCNAQDDDCDGIVDEGLTLTTVYIDSDGDGYADSTTPLTACDPGPGSGWAAIEGDCDSTRRDVYPNAPELCDGIDNDCDGTTDEGVAFDHWFDGDGDGYTDGPYFGCPFDYSYETQPSSEPDCDDRDASINPGAADNNCDRIDNDCDGIIDDDPGAPATGPFGPLARVELYTDADLDGDGAEDSELVWYCVTEAPIPGTSDNNLDCDDDNAQINIRADDVCDGIDNNCSGAIDENLTLFTAYDDVDGDGLGGAAHQVCALGAGQVLTPGDCHDGDPNVGLATSWFRDADGDTYGNPDNEIIACYPGLGWTRNSTDCDDTAADVSPLGTETCDGRDEDCDLATDEDLATTVFFADLDGDGYGGDPVVACAPGQAVVEVGGDCDDSVATIYPGATEFCGDTIDQDCSGADLVCNPTDSDGDGFCGGNCTDGSRPGDCNDSDPAINPWALEICDGIDNDCDGGVDENLTDDADGDGFTEAGSCEGSADDCNDFLVDVFPGATETCNGLDDNCDGVVDEGVRVDADGDGYPAPGCPLVGVPVDCDDNDADVYPGAAEIAGNGVDEDCDGNQDEDPSADDDDGDGYCEGPSCSEAGVLPGDCDDSDPAVNPGPAAIEVVDGIDNDCDGIIDDGATTGLDRDGDGYTLADGDCNDLDPAVHPGALEQCNGFDDNCDGYLPASEIDQDGDLLSPCQGDCDDTRANVRPGLAEDCTDGLDNNCSGEADEDSDYDGDGYTTCNGDCVDLDPNVNPGAPEESCNQLDDDCDRTVDEGLDADRDGVIACTVSQLEGGCVPDLVVCDCDDNNRNVAPGLAEICGDGLDNDCDGKIDNDEDIDNDGWRTCEGDCDDGNPFVSPGTPETCDGKDNDCDRAVDETFDHDLDGWLTCRGDCDDGMAETYPFAEELCDVADNDCNTVVDDPWPDIDGDTYTECTVLVDCAPADPDIGPEVAEVCGDTIDNDCDGDVDWDDADCNGGVYPAYCGCQTGSPSALGLLLLPLALVRRRRTPPGDTETREVTA
ncbi:MAG: hypothetical protein EP330_05015 [Deltaproteobacteria bacterium]|nr:MAG: hypothetical protein EP330_05015 [Deltaproteobacteria bacterium]